MEINMFSKAHSSILHTDFFEIVDKDRAKKRTNNGLGGLIKKTLRLRRLTADFDLKLKDLGSVESLLAMKRLIDDHP